MMTVITVMTLTKKEKKSGKEQKPPIREWNSLKEDSKNNLCMKDKN